MAEALTEIFAAFRQTRTGAAATSAAPVGPPAPRPSGPHYYPAAFGGQGGRYPWLAPVSGPFGTFSLDVELDGSVLRVRSSLNVTRARINADDYPRFRAFLMEVDAALGSPISVSAPGGS